MGIGLILLALLPLALFPDMLFGDSDEASNDTNSEPVHAGAGSLLGDSDVAHDYEVSVVSLLDAEPSDGPSDDEAAALDPVIEDDQPDTGDQEPNPDDILAPVVEDDVATPSDGQEGEILDPIIEDDSGPDITWVESDEHADDVHAEIEGFQIGEDILQVSLGPDVAQDQAEVMVAQSDDGEDSLVFVGEHLVAVLKGVANATVADVYVDTNWLAA
ncbi:MAG: hypothetical protein ACU0DI_07450 [Paracoccaceae bacterium]